MRPDKRTARPGDGNARAGGKGKKFITNNNYTIDSISAALTAHKYADSVMCVATASDADSAAYRTLTSLMLLARVAAALLESEAA